MTNRESPSRQPDHQKAANVVRDAGGRIVGRTRLQKIAYLLELAGVGEGFRFEYRHYGPYSEVLTQSIRRANLFGLVSEQECPASWGGTYSIFKFTGKDQPSPDKIRRSLVETAVNSDPIELELAATAAFLQQEGEAAPWAETASRKPDKAQRDRLDRAKELYQQLRMASENRLPEI